MVLILFRRNCCRLVMCHAVEAALLQHIKQLPHYWMKICISDMNVIETGRLPVQNQMWWHQNDVSNLVSLQNISYKLLSGVSVEYLNFIPKWKWHQKWIWIWHRIADRRISFFKWHKMHLCNVERELGKTEWRLRRLVKFGYRHLKPLQVNYRRWEMRPI